MGRERALTTTARMWTAGPSLPTETNVCFERPDLPALAIGEIEASVPQLILQGANSFIVVLVLAAIDGKLDLRSLSCVQEDGVLIVSPPKLVQMCATRRWVRRRIGQGTPGLVFVGGLGEDRSSERRLEGRFRPRKRPGAAPNGASPRQLWQFSSSRFRTPFLTRCQGNRCGEADHPGPTDHCLGVLS